jgi:hypothetical protein
MLINLLKNSAFVVIVYFILSILFVICCGDKKKDHFNELKNQPTHDYKFCWQANPETDMLYYNVYAWHGEDTLNTPFQDSALVSSCLQYFLKKVRHESGVSNIRDTIAYFANGDWLHFAVCAVNSQGGMSRIATSNFLKSRLPSDSNIAE